MWTCPSGLIRWAVACIGRNATLASTRYPSESSSNKARLDESPIGPFGAAKAEMAKVATASVQTFPPVLLGRGSLHPGPQASGNALLEKIFVGRCLPGVTIDEVSDSLRHDGSPPTILGQGELVSDQGI